MAEAEDVLVDAARHGAAYAQALWRRRRAGKAGPQPLRLAELAQRLDLLLAAAFGASLPLRVAQPPAPPTWLARWMARDALPFQPLAVPATDGVSLWLPADAGAALGPAAAVERFRIQAMRQAMRAERGSAGLVPDGGDALLRDLFLLLEARASDAALLARLPGLAAPLAALRRESLAARPALAQWPEPLRPFELLARTVMQAGTGPCCTDDLPAGACELPSLPAAPPQVLVQARSLLALLPWARELRQRAAPVLWRDAWTGDLRTPPAPATLTISDAAHDGRPDGPPPRSARLERSPEVRQAAPGEDDRAPGAWMVQTAQPHEAAEDPMGLQRPTDRDETTASEEFADALSELPQARLVATPGRPKEVLLSDDAPAGRSRKAVAAPGDGGDRLQYPEWDWRAGAYRHPGATVLLLPAAQGPLEWVERTLAERGAMLHEVRRRFELLRARRVRLRKQLEGDAVDLDAWAEAQADFRAGLPLEQRLYQSERRTRRDLAVALLVDVSGSTDSWVTADRRVIDVEREALLLVSVALEGMGDPYAVLAFSGEGPGGVVIRRVKDFEERHGPAVARRIAGLEPEHYTRAGTALRHATSLLLGRPAAHRLLLLLSDGKPNDVDEYEGRYGVEDMRQAVTEARLQGVSPFCLTIDRQAAGYLPAVFGAHHYALLPRPELLPTVLLDWLRRLVSA